MLTAAQRLCLAACITQKVRLGSNALIKPSFMVLLLALVACPSKPVISWVPAHPGLYLSTMVLYVAEKKQHPVSHQVATVLFLHLEDQLIHPNNGNMDRSGLGSRNPGLSQWTNLTNLWITSLAQTAYWWKQAFLHNNSVGLHPTREQMQHCWTHTTMIHYVIWLGLQCPPI